MSCFPFYSYIKHKSRYFWRIQTTSKSQCLDFFWHWLLLDFLGIFFLHKNLSSQMHELPWTNKLHNLSSLSLFFFPPPFQLFFFLLSFWCWSTSRQLFFYFILTTISSYQSWKSQRTYNVSVFLLFFPSFFVLLYFMWTSFRNHRYLD